MLANEIVTGGYQVEIRTASSYGVPWEPRELATPLGLDNSGNFGSQMGRSFDTNDRLADAVTLVVNEPQFYRDGDTFVLSDGLVSTTFEFVDVNIPGAAAAQGNIEIFLDQSSDTTTTLAAKIRDAINSPAAQLALSIRARSGDSTETGPTSSRRIDLFGDTVLLNPTIGQNLFVDLVAAEQLVVPANPFRGPTTDTFARAVNTGYRSGAVDTH